MKHKQKPNRGQVDLVVSRDPSVRELCRILRKIAYEQATRVCSGSEWGNTVINEIDKLEDAWNRSR